MDDGLAFGGVAFGGGLSKLEAALPVGQACVVSGVSAGGDAFGGDGLSWVRAAMPVMLACWRLC